MSVRADRKSNTMAYRDVPEQALHGVVLQGCYIHVARFEGLLNFHARYHLLTCRIFSTSLAQKGVCLGTLRFRTGPQGAAIQAQTRMAYSLAPVTI